MTRILVVDDEPEIRSLLGAVQVLYMSGYTNDAIVRHGVLDPDTLFIQKPFSPAALGHRVRAAIDGSGGQGHQR